MSETNASNAVPQEEEPQLLPNYFDLLSIPDQNAYKKMRQELSSSSTKFKRYQRIKSLQDALTLIKTYCMRSDADDYKRCVVCGVCWMGWDIAINTRQLRLLINKCKSSINGALAKMGYSTVPIKGDASASLLDSIPLLKGNFAEQRMWTVRRKLIQSPSPIINQGFASPYFNFQPGLFVSPQPYMMNVNINPVKNDIESVFGHHNVSPSEVQKEDNTKAQINVIGQDNEVNFNDFDNDKTCYLEDPCCCCPLEWVNDESESDNDQPYFELNI